MQPFADLGALVEGRWRDKNYDENLFPGIAARALREADLTARVDPWEIIRWVHTTNDFPRQMDPQAKFGNPPITLFAGPRFYVDVYYWLDSTTAIHQHAFSGAFQVLLGSSVHSDYAFKKAHEINPHLLTGDISLKDVALLGKGDIRRIHPGSRFIHSLFHLERPSATIVIRSNDAPSAPVQYKYLKPHLAIDPFLDEPWMIRKVQTVSLLLRMEHPEADQMIFDLLDTADFHTTFSVLDTAFMFLGRNELEELFQVSKSADRFQAMLDRARRRHGALADLLPAVFDEKLRQADIVKRRGLIEGADHRFFLALLLNVPERTKALDLVKQRFPDKEPVEVVIGWVRELSKIKIFGSTEPNVLGIKSIDDAYLEVLAGLLRGLPDKKIRALAADKPARLPADELAANIKSSSLFKSIFTQEATPNSPGA
ncbi:MAG TPA: hypothetical protein VMX97_08345 [Hyphomicrobiaceae bacterium]|nr:hypothetical protein [Hyphomicrobiaceae bacterium]